MVILFDKDYLRMKTNQLRLAKLNGHLVYVSGLILLSAALLVGCGDRIAQDNLGEVRGQPIRPKTTNATPVLAESSSSTDVPTNNPAAATSTNTVAAAEPSFKSSSPDHKAVGFDVLGGYAVELPDEMLAQPADGSSAQGPSAGEQIPPSVQALDKKKIAVRGFMLPLKVQAGQVTELLIMRDQSMCCYGTVPKINEWISVKMTGSGVKPIMDEPVTLYGTLHVGEMRENGYLVGIYSMDGERAERSTE